MHPIKSQLQTRHNVTSLTKIQHLEHQNMIQSNVTKLIKTQTHPNDKTISKTPHFNKVEIFETNDQTCKVHTKCKKESEDS